MLAAVLFGNSTFAQPHALNQVYSLDLKTAHLLADSAKEACKKLNQNILKKREKLKRGFPFNMYRIDLEGKGLEKISRDKGFDAFPMFSPDGKKIIFASNRNNGGTRDTNLFVADWVE